MSWSDLGPDTTIARQWCAGVVVGLLAMGETLPSGASMKALRLLSWVVTVVGVSALANGKGAHVL